MTDYPLLDVMWTMAVFFAWLVWFWLLITIFSDLFRRQDVSGWGKAAWTIAVVFLPYLGVLAYVIGQGRGMSERRAAEATAAKSQFDEYVRSVSTTGGGGAADQIAKAKQLLDAGGITPQEYEALKQKALVG